MCAIIRMVWVLDLMERPSGIEGAYCQFFLQDEMYIIQVIVSNNDFILGIFMEKIVADRSREDWEGIDRMPLILFCV